MHGSFPFLDYRRISGNMNLRLLLYTIVLLQKQHMSAKIVLLLYKHVLLFVVHFQLLFYIKHSLEQEPKIKYSKAFVSTITYTMYICVYIYSPMIKRY